MAVKIGFDGEELSTEESKFYSDKEEKESEENHGDHFNFEKKMSVYIPEHRIQKFLDEFDCVVVQDYGDDYHLSDEERREKFKFYEVFKTFSRCKHKYRRLDQYVKAMREFLKCLDAVAEKNGFYDPDKFKSMYLNNQLYINGLFIPRLVGKERKNIDIDYLTEFIFSDEDPSILMKKKNVDEVYTYEDCEEILETFSDEELSTILREPTQEDIIDDMLPFYDDHDPIGENVVLDCDSKCTKKMIKENPLFLQIIKNQKAVQRSIQNMSMYAYDITSEDLDYIERYNRKHNYISSADVPEFKGNLMRDKDFDRYMHELDEWEEDNVYDVYAGKTKSIGEIRELELKQLLESCGWNLRALYDNKDKEKILKKQLKRDKEREKELKKKLLDIDNRRKRRMGEAPVKIKNKKSKKAKVGKKEKKRLNKTMNEFLDSSCKSHKGKALDWTNI